MSLAELFPEHEPSKKVADPLFLGGTVDMNLVFALVEERGSRKDGSIRIAPDLFFRLRNQGSRPDHRVGVRPRAFFLGLVVWRPGQLDDELDRGLWYVQEPEAKLVLRGKPTASGRSWCRRGEARANTI